MEIATSFIFCLKGCLIGGFLGLTFSLWLSLGSVIYGPKPKILPPVSVEGCNINNLNSTYETPVNYTLINVIESTTSLYQSFTSEIVKKDDAIYSSKVCNAFLNCALKEILKAFVF